jgi:hypothetical protein
LVESDQFSDFSHRSLDRVGAAGLQVLSGLIQVLSIAL